MKFGKNLSVQQSKCEWLHYLNYKDLKKGIKIDARDDTFDAQLQAEIEAVNNSFSHQVGVIQRDLALVASGSEATVVTVSERLRRLMTIAEQVEVLRRFAVWNAVAVVKILKKRTKALAGPSPPGLGGALGEASPPVALVAAQVPTSGVTAETWLSRQLFFSGSDFAELQAQLESLAGQLGRDRLSELPSSHWPRPATSSGLSAAVADRCPICLDECVDAVELTSCGHRFCWKCVVLGPIAFAPGEYRLSRCSVCRNEQPLDPTRNFKTVCSNQLALLTEWATDETAGEDAQWWDSAQANSLEVLYGTASGKSQLESAKERQAMESLDAPSGGMTAFFCALCCEPLLLEAVSTTPCKHHFHRFCLEKISDPKCPLCGEVLPMHLVTPRFVHPVMLRGVGVEMVSYLGCVVERSSAQQYTTPFGAVKPFSPSLIEAKRALAKSFSLR